MDNHKAINAAGKLKIAVQTPIVAWIYQGLSAADFVTHELCAQAPREDQGHGAHLGLPQYDE
jgi:hypothetical protein